MNLPQSIELIEVGPRDGFQNIPEWIPTETKMEVIDLLAASGFKKIELTSFVHPKAIPQMADAAAVLSQTKQKHPALECIALVPNLFGAKKAIEAGADAITFVLSASEKHNLENTRQTVEQSLQAFTEVCRIKGKTKVRLAVATAFDCPFAGKTPPDDVLRLIEAGLKAGADDIDLCDTIGTANPVQTEDLLTKASRRFPKIPFILHLHDTRGMGLANALTAMALGYRRFEGSIGGLGGCPFAPGAAGNIATEDLLNMLADMGVPTGIDLDKLLAAARLVQEKIPGNLTGHMVKVKPCTN